MDFSQISSILLASAEGSEHHGPSYWGLVFYMGLLLAITFILIGIARTDFKNRIFRKKPAQWSEQMYLFIENMCVNIIGSHGRRFVPFIGTLWIVIFLGNSIALFFPTSTTADLSFNLALAIIAICYVQFAGVQGHAEHDIDHGKPKATAWFTGIFKHIKHFAGPKLPLGIALFVTPLLFIVELISEAMKNVSLSLRLYGNIYGGHAAVDALNKTTEYFPIGGLLLVVKLLTVVVQALVFTLLTCVYISIVTHHEEDHKEGQPAAAH